jgi:hypothetical protein
VYELTLATGLFLLAASFFAGFVDSIAGGGGLIQLPALLIGLPNSGTAEVLGTNKLSAVFWYNNCSRVISQTNQTRSKNLAWHGGSCLYRFCRGSGTSFKNPNEQHETHGVGSSYCCCDLYLV